MRHVNHPSTQLVTVNEFAELVALKPATIRRKILERRIAFVKIGRAVRLPIEEAQRLIRDGFRPVVAV